MKQPALLTMAGEVRFWSVTEPESVPPTIQFAQGVALIEGSTMTPRLGASYGRGSRKNR